MPVRDQIEELTDDIEEPSLIGLNLWIMPDGDAVVYLGGDLDFVSAEAAFGYVADVIDRCRGQVVVDLSELDYCDARGLRALARMRAYAEHSGCPFQLASPSEPLVKILRITGLSPQFRHC